MNKDINDAIELSRSTLVLRHNLGAFLPTRSDLPLDIVDFFSRIEGGILFPLEFDDGTTDGFEIAHDFKQSINQFYCLPEGDKQFGHFDLCFVLFRSTLDFESAWAIDLNPTSFGRIFTCRMALGEHPQHHAIVVAKSFNEWLRFWNSNYRQAAGDWRSLAKEPDLGPVV